MVIVLTKFELALLNVKARGFLSKLKALKPIKGRIGLFRF